MSAMAEASEFKFGKQLGLAKAHHNITPREKSVYGLGLGELTIILGSPIIFLQRLGLATSNLARSWGLPRTITKSHAEENGAWPWARGAPINLGVPLQFFDRLAFAYLGDMKQNIAHVSLLKL